MINIMYTGNGKMFDGILISLISMLEHTSKPLHVYIITMELKSLNKEFNSISLDQCRFIENLIKKKNLQSCVTLLDATDMYYKTMISSPNTKTDYTPYCFLRLFADKLPVPDKILYLDTDTIINHDISMLYDIDVSEYQYGAVLDHYGRIFMGYHYINSGVMLLNMREIRSTKLFSRCIELCSKKRLFLPDQTALHRFTQKKLLLDEKFNQQKDYCREDTVIQHFSKTIIWLPYFHTKNIKPWETEKVHNELTHRYDGILMKYLCAKKEFEHE